MFKSGSSRFVFLSAAVLMLALGVMLMGSTFATDFYNDVNYTTERNTLADDNALNFNVDLLYHDGSQYTSMLNPKVAVFDSNTSWCPNRTEIVFLKLSNSEEFPVNCTLKLQVADSTFDNTLSYAVIQGKDLKETGLPKNWKAFESDAGSSKTLTNGEHTLLQQLKVSGKSASTPSGEYALAVAVHMDQNATSAYQNASMNLQFVLQADANYASGTTLEDLNKQ